MDNFSTGISNLDTFLGGGLSVGSTTVIVGGVASGKTLLSKRIFRVNPEATLIEGEELEDLGDNHIGVTSLEEALSTAYQVIRMKPKSLVILDGITSLPMEHPDGVASKARALTSWFARICKYQGSLVLTWQPNRSLIDRPPSDLIPKELSYQATKIISLSQVTVGKKRFIEVAKVKDRSNNIHGWLRIALDNPELSGTTQLIRRNSRFERDDVL